MRGARGLHHRGGDRGRRGDHASGRSRHICAAGARRPEPHHRDGAVEEITRVADHVIYVPPVRDALSPITATVPLQLLAREVAVLRGCDVDQPRNLAKRGRRSARLRGRSATPLRQSRDGRVAAIRPQPDAGIKPMPASTRRPHQADAAHLRIEALHQGPPCVAEGAITRRILASPLPDEAEVMLDCKIVGRDVDPTPASSRRRPPSNRGTTSGPAMRRRGSDNAAHTGFPVAR